MKGIFPLCLWMAAMFMPRHVSAQWPPKSTSRLIKIEINSRGALISPLPNTINPTDTIQFFIHGEAAKDTGHIDVYRQTLLAYQALLNNSDTYLPGYRMMFNDASQTDAAQAGEIDKTIAYLNTPDKAHLAALASNKLLPVPGSDFAAPASRITISYPGKDPVSLDIRATATGAASEPFPVDTLGDFKAGQAFTFEITLVDKYKELIIGHLNKTHGYFQRDNEKKWHQLMKALLSHAPLMDSVTAIRKAHAEGKIDDAVYKDSIAKKCARISRVEQLLDQLKASDNNRWLATWLWYTGGLPRFNPFDFSNGQPLKTYTTAQFKADTSQYYQSFITAINKAIDQQRLSSKPNSPDTILMLAEKKKQGEAKLIDKSTGQAFIDKQNNRADAFSQSEKIVYRGDLLISTKDRLRYIRYHDRLKSYTLSQKLPRDYPEDYAMHIGLVNVPGNKTVTLDQRLSDFTEKAEFSIQLQESLGALSTGKSSVTETAKTVAALLATIKKAAVSGNTPGCVQSAQAYAELYHFVTMGYNGDLPVPEKLTPQTDSSQYQYTTILAGQDDKAAPFTNEYSIIERLASDTSKKQIAKGFRYNVGKLRSFAIGAGLAFGFSQVRQVNVDSVGALSTTTDAARAKFIVGLKYYPFKTFLRDNGICPRWPERRFSLFGGFEVLDPLNNLYLGIGYDIVPGLNVNAGANFYRQNYYRIQNDRILDKATRMPAVGYLAVTLDPEVVVDLIKLMAK